MNFHRSDEKQNFTPRRLRDRHPRTIGRRCANFRCKEDAEMLILTVRVRVSRNAREGVLAQLVERLNGIEEVRGSNPLGSTENFFVPVTVHLDLAGLRADHEPAT